MLETHVSNLSMHPSIAGYSSDLDLPDVPEVSPSFAKPDLDPFGDCEISAEEWEDRTLSEGKSPSECEALALADELHAVALDLAIKEAAKHAKGLIDPATGLVPAGRQQSGAAPSVTYIRMSFRLAVLRSAAKRLRERALRLRREAERKYLAEATAQRAVAGAPTDAPKKRTKRKLAKIVETADQRRRRLYAARMAAAAHT